MKFQKAFVHFYHHFLIQLYDFQNIQDNIISNNKDQALFHAFVYPILNRNIPFMKNRIPKTKYNDIAYHALF